MDGRRFVVAPPAPTVENNPGQSQLVFVLNFFSELRGLLRCSEDGTQGRPWMQTCPVAGPEGPAYVPHVHT